MVKTFPSTLIGASYPHKKISIKATWIFIPNGNYEAWLHFFLSKIDDGLASSFGNMAIVSFDLDMKTIMEYLFGSVHTWFRTRAKSTLPPPPGLAVLISCRPTHYSFSVVRLNWTPSTLSGYKSIQDLTEFNNASTKKFILKCNI